MGQYWYPVNLDKKEFLNPFRFNSGLNIWEQVIDNPGTKTALVILCAALREIRGGGDFEPVEDVVGRWAGDRIAYVGDYAEDTDLPAEFMASTIYDKCQEGEEFKDISNLVVPVVEKLCNGTFMPIANGLFRWRKND